ncbi:hypothetical protein AB0E78_24975 [Streptomyces sp. NPDC032198]|uniref:hypothetical protein n=1 Tax=Streptomyces sp. NPDC032198 TaxID=3155127 RepID=UPI0033C400B4
MTAKSMIMSPRHMSARMSPRRMGARMSPRHMSVRMSPRHELSPMNPRNLLTPLPETPPLRRWLTRLIGVGLAVATYLLCLPWDLRNRPETPGAINETTPVTALGITALAVSMLSLAAYFGFRDRLIWALLMVAGPPATLMYVSFDSHPEPDAAVWPLAWGFFVLVMGTGVLAVAGFARLFRDSEA